MMSAVPSTNKDWGFWGMGTISHHADPSEAWPLAIRAIAGATGFGESAVRDFLDSRHGRHFADDVTNSLHDNLALPAAIDTAVERWMAWNVDRYMQAQTGIPCDLPYLVGLVGDFEFEAEFASAHVQ
jgi:hypothetical protein